MLCPPDRTRFIKSDTQHHGSRLFTASLYSTPHRYGGRRVVVTENGAPVFDSGDHYDNANAVNALDNWLASVPVCAHCGADDADAFRHQGQDQESGRPLCDGCVAKALGSVEMAQAGALAAGPELVAVRDCPF